MERDGIDGWTVSLIRMYLPFMKALESHYAFLEQANINTYFGFMYSNTLGVFVGRRRRGEGGSPETFHCSLMNQELSLEDITL